MNENDKLEIILLLSLHKFLAPEIAYGKCALRLAGRHEMIRPWVATICILTFYDFIKEAEIEFKVAAICRRLVPIL